MKFSVMITTRNRCADLRRTLERLTLLQPPPAEILVCADGCSDATVPMVQMDFPSVRLVVHDISRGSVQSRDELLRLASGDWVCSFDDDSYPVDRDFLSRLDAVIEAHPEAAVICFPEQRENGSYAAPDKTPSIRGHYVSAYANCASSMNRSFYLEQPGFPAHFVHMYEEPDFALQCYAAGSAVWFEPSLTVFHHMVPQQRQPVRRHQMNARNELWSVWMRCPWPWLPLVSIYRALRQFQSAWKQGIGFVVKEPAWWLGAINGGRTCWNNRRVVPWRKYLFWMQLARRPIHDSAELKSGSIS